MNKHRSRRRLVGNTSRRQLIKHSVAVAVSAPVLSAMATRKASAAGQVNVYNWDTYIGETTLQDFSSASGIEVRYDLFADNAELFARLREGNPGYDVIVPTNDFTERMILAEMLQKVDKSKIPNFSNLDAAFQDAAFDPGREYSIPYFWGTIGLGYRLSAVDPAPNSWGVIFDKSDAYSGRTSWLAEPSTLIQMALKYLGYSINTTDMDQLKEAEAVLAASKGNVKSIAGDNGQDLLLAGDVDICMEWNGDILQVMEEDDDLSYVVPDEGGLIWQDTFAIPSDAPNVGEAHEFINYILEPEVHAEIADFIYYALPNAAAKELMSPEYLDNPAIFPTDEILAKSESAKYLGEDINSFYSEALTRVRAA
ncbi:MAG: spermidine/putrescine ABC transporter substrate-binding protein [Pseudomonadota bacterium]